VEQINGKFSAVDYGVIETPSSMKFSDRLVVVAESIKHLAKTHKIEYAGVEDLYFSTNKSTAMQVSQARGVLVVALKECGVTVYNFTPNQVKSVLTGQGKATKEQVEYMVKKHLGITEKIRPDDASDAIAIAITHLMTNKNSLKEI
ncbi:MAG: crossover junction endodeoxyribonuclease RuvC, partial [Firmicutes bacterium]|nr:crossover junction endodeoxyribonuclease RuvC [Bacillota bacterium]